MLTYIEPCGWCSSSIPSSCCPSNVNKYPNLSLSSISTSDNISISTTNSTSSTCLIRSSCSHPNDYYTSKRIDELHERMDDIQISSFLKFINHHLSLNKPNENLSINDLVKDLSNGHVLIDLIEILSSTKLKREHGRTRFHSLANIQYVLDYLKLRMQHINISPHEIVEGNRKQILALLWIIMKIFHFPDFQLKTKNCFVENTLLGFGQDRSIILKWLNHILNHGLNYSKISIQDFSLQTWNNGYYLSLIIKYLIPLSNKYLTLKCFDYLKELNSSLNNQQFQICLNLSNYCFNTMTIIDYNDKSDKCLFKYFTELQQNVLNILKTNQIGKLIQNNPYTKQILQTIEHSSNVISDNEQYLVCIQDEKQATLNSMEHLSRIPTVEKSRLFNGEQQTMIMKRTNQSVKIDNISSNSHVINDHQEITNQLNGTAEEIEPRTNDQVEVEVEPSIVIIEDLSTGTEQVTGKNIENQFDETSEQLRQCIGLNEENNNEQKVMSQEVIEEQKQLLLSNEKIQIEPLEQTITNNKSSNDINENYESLSVSSNEEDEQLTDAIEEQKQVLSSNEKIESLKQTITENNPSNNINENLESFIKEIQQQQQEMISSNEEDEQSMDEYEILEQKIESVKEIEQSTAVIDEQKQVLSSNKKNEPLEQIGLTIIDNKPPVDVNGTEEAPPQAIAATEEKNKFTIEHKTFEQHLESQSSIIANEENKQNAMAVVHNGTTITSNEEPKTEFKETKQLIDENEKLNQSSISTEKVEQFIENNSSKLSSNVASNRKAEQSTITIIQNNPVSTNEKSEQSTVTTSINTGKKLEKPAVIEPQRSIVSNGQHNKSITVNKKTTVNIKNSVPMASSFQENQYSADSNERSTMVVKEPEQRKVALERPVQTAAAAAAPTTRNTKYSEIVSNQTSKSNNESVQGTSSFKKQEQSTVSKKKTASNENFKPVSIIAEEIEQIPFINTNKESEQPEVSLEKQESSVSAKSNEETKKSASKNKKSRRSNAKKGKVNNSSIKIGTSSQQPIVNIIEEEEIKPSSPVLTPTAIPQEQKIQSEIQNSSLNHENPPANSSVTRSRKSKKKKTVATTTTTLVNKSSLSPSLPSSTAPHRNLFVIIKESLHDRKVIAFKCVVILICLCFSIIILVLSHK